MKIYDIINKLYPLGAAEQEELSAYKKLAYDNNYSKDFMLKLTDYMINTFDDEESIDVLRHIVKTEGLTNKNRKEIFIKYLSVYIEYRFRFKDKINSCFFNLSLRTVLNNKKTEYPGWATYWVEILHTHHAERYELKDKYNIDTSVLNKYKNQNVTSCMQILIKAINMQDLGQQKLAKEYLQQYMQTKNFQFNLFDYCLISKKDYVKLTLNDLRDLLFTAVNNKDIDFLKDIIDIDKQAADVKIESLCDTVTNTLNICADYNNNDLPVQASTEFLKIN